MKFSWLIQSVSSSCTTTTILLDGVSVSRRLGPVFFFCFIWLPQLPPHEACWSNNVAFVSLLHKSTVIWYKSWHMTRGKNVTESHYIKNSFSRVLNTSAVLQVQEYTLSSLSVGDVKMWPEMRHPHHSEAKRQQDVVYNEHQRHRHVVAVASVKKVRETGGVEEGPSTINIPYCDLCCKGEMAAVAKDAKLCLRRALEHCQIGKSITPNRQQ